MPNSSPATAKTKSAWLSGMMRLTDALARPDAEPAAVDDRLAAHVDLEGVALAGRGSGRYGRRRAERRCRRRSRRPRRARRATTIQNHGMPAMKNITPQVPSDQHGLAEVRLRHQQRHARRRAGSWRRGCRECRAGAACSANSQAQMMTKAGFRNSDGWIDTPANDTQRRAPFTSTPMNEHGDHQRPAMTPSMIERQPPHLARRRGRRRASSATSAGTMKTIWRVAKWKLSRPMRSATGRARREGQHDAERPSATGRRPGTSGRPSTTSWRRGCGRGGSTISCLPPMGLTPSMRAHGLPEGFAAYFEILELVEAGAGRRKQHHRLAASSAAASRSRVLDRAPPACPEIS